jgi:hypothetical protein
MIREKWAIQDRIEEFYALPMQNSATRILLNKV